jgi:hypothetical protein
MVIMITGPFDKWDASIVEENQSYRGQRAE